jgi:hypothetical protein
LLFNDNRPRHHTYSSDIACLCICLFLNSCTSLRSAPKALSLFSKFFDLNFKIPSWYSIRTWLLKLGYYKLNRKKEKSDNWIWIVDHSIQYGQEKCMVILGVQADKLPDADTNLYHEDVDVLALFPVKKSNGEIVYKQLEETARRTGVPKQIVSDHGSDIKCGSEQFCEKNPRTILTYDITHKAAVILKRELDKDEIWKLFLSLAANTRKRLQQTSLAAIAPPNQRSKARYMNIDRLVKWGTDKLLLMDSPQYLSELGCSKEYLLEKLGWLCEFRYDLEEWSDMVYIIKEAESFVKIQGLYKNCHSDLKKMPTFKAAWPKAQQIKIELLRFLKQESALIEEGDRLVGSSEVIESVFGKTKRLANEQSKSGFTGFILSLAAMVSETASDVVHKALETFKMETVNNWVKENIGSSVQSRRVRINHLIKQEQK